MPTHWASSADGTRIAYEQTGEGPLLLLLHGLGPTLDRHIWDQYGYSAALSPAFRVVAMDLRAHGESEAPDDEAAYSVGRILDDVHAVADACQAERFALWGWSWGGTIGLQLAARSNRLTRAVIAGTHFGRIFTEEWAARGIGQAETARTLREQGRLSEMGLPPEVAAAVARAPLTAHIACLRALVSWPEVQPTDLRCPALVYTGTADPDAATLEARRQDIEAAGIVFQVFEGLDHRGLLSARQTVLPPVRAFLRDARS